MHDAMPTTFQRDDFARVQGSLFTLTADSGETIEIELSEVSELKKRSRQQSFAIIFLVPENYRVEQGLYDLSHAELGAVQLFLVPVGMKNSRQELEAVFNTLLDPESDLPL